MVCSKCGGETRTRGTRDDIQNFEVLRKRVCKDCGYTFGTVEFEVELTERFEKTYRELESRRVMSYRKRMR